MYIPRLLARCIDVLPQFGQTRFLLTGGIRIEIPLMGRIAPPHKAEILYLYLNSPSMRHFPRSGYAG